MIEACTQTDPNVLAVWLFGIFLAAMLLLVLIVGWMTR